MNDESTPSILLDGLPTQGASSSSSSSHSSSSVTDGGAGSSSSSEASSPNGSSSSSDSVFTSGATSSNASASANASSTDFTETDAQVSTTTQSNSTTLSPISTEVSGVQPLELCDLVSEKPIVTELIAALLRNDLGYIHRNGVVQRVQGQRSSDRLIGTTRQELFWGDRGDDHLVGRGGNDELDSGIGCDTLLGGQGHDVLNGGEGDDVLNGGSEIDILLGGAGADTFVLHLSRSANGWSSVDIIGDFRTNKGDVLQLSNQQWLQSLLFTPIDTDADGQADATLIQVGTTTPQALAIVLNTVENGTSFLTTASFTGS